MKKALVNSYQLTEHTGKTLIRLSLLTVHTHFVGFAMSWLNYEYIVIYNSAVMCNIKRTGLEVINFFACSTQLSTKFILLINVTMPTIVGILTFISMINTTSERLIAKNVFILSVF